MSQLASHRLQKSHRLPAQCRRSNLLVAASKGAGFTAPNRPPPPPKLPNSAEEAVSQAIDCVAGQVPRVTRRSSTIPPVSKLMIEIPVRDESTSSLVDLATQVARRLDQKNIVEDALIVMCSGSSSSSNEQMPSSNVVALSNAASSLSSSSTIARPLLLVSPADEHLDQLASLLGSWRGSFVLALNPSWSRTPPPAHVALVRSFRTVYSFLPLSVQFFLQKRREGVAIKMVERGESPDTSPWRIYATDGPNIRLIGQQADGKPSDDDIELIFMNDDASQSAMTKAVKGLKNVFDGLGGVKKNE